VRQQGEIRGKWIHVAPTQCRITREPWRKRKSFTMHLVSEPDRRFPCAPHRRPGESGVQVPEAAFVALDVRFCGDDGARAGYQCQRRTLGGSRTSSVAAKRCTGQRRARRHSHVMPRERPAARPRQIKWRRHARTLLSAEAMVLLRSLAAALHGHAPSRLWSSGSRCAGLQQDLNFGDSAIELRGDDAPVKSYL